ncbi:MAG: DISARM system phospholipase D-like protein DrmC [Cyanobacteria bacterium P01_A01_bin.17]
MKSPLHRLSRPALLSLAKAFETGRIQLPCLLSSVIAHVPDALASVVSSEFNRLHSMGMGTQLMAHTLYLLAEERELAQQRHDGVALVWTGDELPGSESRDTYVVVQELFATAKSSVLISSYALDKGAKSRALFEVLAERMDENPSLQVRMFLNIKRPHKDTTPEPVLLRQFVESFRNQLWPGQRLPEVFHDPRALAITPGPKACLHAKCVVIDEERLLVTSANFTEAAHQRNIEAGALIADPVAARALRFQFETLVNKGVLLRVPGL